MGPFLLFQLINGATIGLFNGITTTEAFCEFVDEAGISMLGVVPSLVKAWQARNTTENCDWSKIRRFSSTGEASDPVTSLWLMSRVPGYAPVLEYCGGMTLLPSYVFSFCGSVKYRPNSRILFSSTTYRRYGNWRFLPVVYSGSVKCSFHVFITCAWVTNIAA